MEIMKRIGVLLTVAALICALLPLYTVSAATPDIRLDRAVYSANDTITVSFGGTDTNDWTGLYPAGLLPGSGQNSLLWQYTVGSGTITFATSSLAAGDYTAYLCDNDGYTVLDRVNFTVRGTDTTDYGAVSATVQASVAGGKSTLAVTVTPSSAATLTYRLYWAKNGARLADYAAIKEVTHSGASAFTIVCNECLFMPDEADSIEVAVVEGHSGSFFAAAPAALKVPSSTRLYEFQVLTDLHVSSALPAHVPNLKEALRDVKRLSPHSVGIFTVGDNTDRGTQDQYDLLLQTMSAMDAELNLPTVTYAIGNHDEVYGGTYDEEVARFINNFKTPGLYYAKELQNTKFLMLGSEVQSTAGGIGDAQLRWVEAELASTDPTKPVFLFLHQPLKDTVSGTLSWKNDGIQRWYFEESASAKLHAILKQYPNAVLFSGHTHSSFEQEQPMLYGNGTDATFINAASTAYLWNDQNQDFAGSQGLYVEVYEDYLLVKGRDFTRGQWCASAQFLIPLQNGASDLISENVADWTFDGGEMQVESNGEVVSFYNTNGLWPKADYVMASPITVDPEASSLYVDMMLEETASANLYLFMGNGASLSLNSYLPHMTVDAGSGDLIGNGRRVRGVIDLADIEFPHYNDNGTVTFKQVRIFASGAANAKLTVYDLSVVSDRADKAVSLLNPDALQAVSETKAGGFTYQNGTLTVRSDTDAPYTVRVALDETYNVSLLRELAVKVAATTAFDVTVTASTAATDATFGLAADFWPEFCQEKENGFLPAGTYDRTVDFYSCYTFNGLAPQGGMSTLKTVDITLSGRGTVTIEGLQLSSNGYLPTVQDGVTREVTTPTRQTGDVSGDGAVSTVDVRLILMHTIGVELTEENVPFADVNGDGFITSADVRELLRFVLA